MRSQLRFHPLRVDVAAIGGDEQVFLAAFDVNEAFFVLPAKITGGNLRGGGCFTQIAQHDSAAHPDFA